MSPSRRWPGFLRRPTDEIGDEAFAPLFAELRRLSDEAPAPALGSELRAVLEHGVGARPVTAPPREAPAPAPAGRWRSPRTRVALGGAVAAMALVGTGAAGALPDPAQAVLDRAVDAVGLPWPDHDDPAPPVDESPEQPAVGTTAPPPSGEAPAPVPPIAPSPAGPPVSMVPPAGPPVIPFPGEGTPGAGARPTEPGPPDGLGPSINPPTERPGAGPPSPAENDTSGVAGEQGWEPGPPITVPTAAVQGPDSGAAAASGHRGRPSAEIPVTGPYPSGPGGR